MRRPRPPQLRRMDAATASLAALGSRPAPDGSEGCPAGLKQGLDVGHPPQADAIRSRTPSSAEDNDAGLGERRPRDPKRGPFTDVEIRGNAIDGRVVLPRIKRIGPLKWPRRPRRWWPADFPPLVEGRLGGGPGRGDHLKVKRSFIFPKRGPVPVQHAAFARVHLPRAQHERPLPVLDLIERKARCALPYFLVVRAGFAWPRTRPVA